MEKLSGELHLFIRKQMSENGLWRNLQVIYSDHLIPGEGEHKIMNYIRNTKMQSFYNPNTTHCMYGLDADLIMLSLVSHEIHFSLLREEVIFESGHQRRNVKGRYSQEYQNHKKTQVLNNNQAFQLLHITILRNYLKLEFEELEDIINFYDFERIIDDFVFICMLTGNDFIPALPSINIGSGGIQQLFLCYKEILPQLNGYLIDQSTFQIDIHRLQILFRNLARNEISNFKQQLFKLKSYRMRNSSNFRLTFVELNKNTRKLSVEEIDHQLEIIAGCENFDEEFNKHFHDLYYNQRWTDGKMNDLESRQTLCLAYICALQWNIFYYYCGCPSWSYYYPYHYSPLISDFSLLTKEHEQMQFEFDLSQPFKPFVQLLCVLPIASNKVLPKCYQRLMTDEHSPIAKYYPLEFGIDMNMQTTSWMGIVLLPFIDEQLLNKAIETIDMLTVEEQERNAVRKPVVFHFNVNKEMKDRRVYGPKGFDSMVDAISARYYKLPKIGSFVSRPCSKSDEILCGFPNLHALKFKHFVKMVPVKTFGSNSRYNTLVLEIKSSDEYNYDAIYDRANEIVQNYCGFGCKMFVGWPYFREAKLLTLVTEENIFDVYEKKHGNKCQFRMRQNSDKSREWFHSKCNHLRKHYLYTFGVQLGQILTFVKVLSLMKMKRIRTSKKDEIIHEWSKHESFYPLQCLIFDDNRNQMPLEIDQRFIAREINLDEEFVIGKQVMYIGSNDDYFGKYGKVLDKNELGFVDIRVIDRWTFTDFPLKVMSNGKSGGKYFNVHEICDKLQMDKKLFSRICSEFVIRKKPKDIDIGLGVKLWDKQLYMPGYVRVFKKRGGKGRYSDDNFAIKYSQKLLELIENYEQQFPELFALFFANSNREFFYSDELSNENLNKYLPVNQQIVGCNDETQKNRIFDELQKMCIEMAVDQHDDELIPNTLQSAVDAVLDNTSKMQISSSPKNIGIDKIQGGHYLEKITDWLKLQQTYNLPLINFNARSLDIKIIKDMEINADIYFNEQLNAHKKALILKRTPIKDVYVCNPSPVWSPDKKECYKLGNRVACIRSDLGVPFGTRGTVVGLHDTFVELICDRTVMKGSTLHDRCSDNRGVILPYHSIINLSNRRSVIDEQQDFGNYERSGGKIGKRYQRYEQRGGKKVRQQFNNVNYFEEKQVVDEYEQGYEEEYNDQQYYQAEQYDAVEALQERKWQLQELRNIQQNQYRGRGNRRNRDKFSNEFVQNYPQGRRQRQQKQPLNEWQKRNSNNYY